MKRKMKPVNAKQEPKVYTSDDPECKPDWEGRCLVCGASPIMPITGMCGPCSTGDSTTAGGEW